MTSTPLDLKDKRILVTGGAGFLGRQVVSQLTQAGADPQKITVPDRATAISKRQNSKRYQLQE